jgi:protein SCO1/2
MRKPRQLGLAFATLLALATPALAQLQADPQDVRLNSTPPAVSGVGMEQRLNSQLPLDLEWRNEAGESVTLGRYFDGKPVVLVPAYFTCPTLCGQVINAVTASLKVLKRSAGEDFHVIVFSFDPRDSSEAALSRKRAMLTRYEREGAEQGWHFLTGEQPSIDALTEAIGFEYKYDEAIQQFVHVAGIVVATENGKLSRYFYGSEFAPRDLRLALVESAGGKIGSPVEALLLYCYQYDPTSGRYGAVVMNMVRVGGLLTIVGVALMILIFRVREMRRETATGEAG